MLMSLCHSSTWELPDLQKAKQVCWPDEQWVCEWKALMSSYSPRFRLRILLRNLILMPLNTTFNSFKQYLFINTSCAQVPKRFFTFRCLEFLLKRAVANILALTSKWGSLWIFSLDKLMSAPYTIAPTQFLISSEELSSLKIIAQ